MGEIIAGTIGIGVLGGPWAIGIPSEQLISESSITADAVITPETDLSF
ncbi:MAG TPA: hypothetical protein VGP72_05555 [Planctomycetota bacterium]